VKGRRAIRTALTSARPLRFIVLDDDRLLTPMGTEAYKSGGHYRGIADVLSPETLTLSFFTSRGHTAGGIEAASDQESSAGWFHSVADEAGVVGRPKSMSDFKVSRKAGSWRSPGLRRPPGENNINLSTSPMPRPQCLGRPSMEFGGFYSSRGWGPDQTRRFCAAPAISME
jgi:hypothetical protein